MGEPEATSATEKKEKQEKPSAVSLVRRVRESRKAFAIRAYQKLGNISAACQVCGVHRVTFHRWLNSDKAFAEKYAAVRESMIDNAESHLLTMIKEGNIAATIFFLKCQGKHRGYVERQEFTGKDGGPIKVDKSEEVLKNLNDGELDTLAAILAKAERADAVRGEEGAGKEETSRIH